MPNKPPTRPRRDLEQAFDAWCVHQRQIGRLRRGSSEAVYRAMWQALTAWCTAQQPPLRLADLHAPALARYLASRTGLLLADGLLTPRYQWRLLSLAQRVQAHRQWLQQPAGPAAARQLAPARPAPRVADLTAGYSQPLLYLSAAEDQHLQQTLVQAPTPGTRWQLQRDRSAVALQLGGGLGPGDVRALRLADVLSDGGPVPGQPWQLRVPANGSAPTHVSPLAPWASQALLHWLQLRQTQALGGDWLFPSTRSGKPWGKVAQYQAALKVMAETGIPADGGGSFRLRHSFALRQLRHGHDEALIARWLGVIDPAVTARYRLALGADAPDQPAASPSPTTAWGPLPV